MKYTDVISVLNKKASKNKAKLLMRFFKTGEGQYGEGDVFLGVTMPEERKVAKEFTDLPIGEVKKLLKSKYHECRMVALLILIQKYKSYSVAKPASAKGYGEVKHIFDVYVLNTKYINNWDLVDLSAPNIVGSYLSDKPRDILYKFAKSKSLWERRISVISTSYFIRQNDFKDTLKIAEILLPDKHDLIHKAVGWMLREVGKKNERVLCKFLDKNLTKMSRTALRYSIERFPEESRQYYLKK